MYGGLEWPSFVVRVLGAMVTVGNLSHHCNSYVKSGDLIKAEQNALGGVTFQQNRRDVGAQHSGFCQTPIQSQRSSLAILCKLLAPLSTYI